MRLQVRAVLLTKKCIWSHASNGGPPVHGGSPLVLGQVDLGPPVQQAELAHVAENIQSHMHSESAPVTEQEIQHGSTNPQTVGKDQLSDLQLKVESLTTRQVNLEKAQERERRKCNVIVGNVEEETNKSAADVKTTSREHFLGSLKVGCKRIGKFHQNKTRLILV